MRLLLIALMIASIAACSAAKITESLLTPEERALVRAAIGDVARGDSASLSRKVPAETAAKIPGAMPNMQRALPSPPHEIAILNAVVKLGTPRIANVIYQVKGQSGWAVVHASIQTTAGHPTLISLYIERTAVEPRKLNGFSLANAGAGGLAMLAAMLSVAAITIAALIRIWRSGRFDRRWLWTIGALLGFATMRYNWSTGEIGFQPLSFQLMSLGAYKQPIYAPWILAVSVPVVALIALFKQGYDSWEEPGIYPDAAEKPDG